MKIISNFDSGSIQVKSARANGHAVLALRPDNDTDIMQWFCFDVVDAKNIDCELVIQNAGQAAFKKGWQDYQACLSQNGTDWQRTPTEFDGERLTIRLTPRRQCVRIAYFPPYSLARHYKLIAASQRSGLATVETVGKSVDGHRLDALIVGQSPKPKPKCWIIARQHPGETMAEWWVEGFLERLLSSDAVAEKLRRQLSFHVVPNMNPDGSRRGHLRTNALGFDLNRAWQEPDPEKTPEVFLVRDTMTRTGVDFFLDIHGDEILPYLFLTGGYGIPTMSSYQERTRDYFMRRMLSASPEFQTERGYPKAQPGKANLAIGANFVAEHFGAISFTLEQPFKDNAHRPVPESGWSPERARAHGAATLDAIAGIEPFLTRNYKKRS